ncbi:putative deacetylase LmbE-like domain-containing protein [Hyaloraphidium curvatum]|nr:putative deacetylase LmbE-like domain-containing protein [Hyaloraphidium curvatum]
MAPQVTAIPPGDGRSVLIVTAHADDAALFLGGTVAMWAVRGWRVVLVRVTDDRWDSVGIPEKETIEANRREFEAAARVLGVAETVHLEYPTDTLGDASEVQLREKIIRLVRTHRPYALVTFDPYSHYGEDNYDHKLVAGATDEAFWTSQFDKHHPEHHEQGLKPHGCFERWYFGRRVTEITDVIDISETLDRKVEAAKCHRTPMRNFVNQLRLQADTGGWDVPLLDEAMKDDEKLDALVGMLFRAGSERTGAKYELPAAEEFRVVRFGGLQGLLDMFGVKRAQQDRV